MNPQPVKREAAGIHPGWSVTLPQTTNEGSNGHA